MRLPVTSLIIPNFKKKTVLKTAPDFDDISTICKRNYPYSNNLKEPNNELDHTRKNFLNRFTNNYEII